MRCLRCAVAAEIEESEVDGRARELPRFPETSIMDALAELQRLSLISKVCAELDNHMGLSDKTLAEFLVHLASNSSAPDAFAAACTENGAEFPAPFAHNLWRIIQEMNPSAPRSGRQPTARAVVQRAYRGTTATLLSRPRYAQHKGGRRRGRPWEW